MISLVGYTGFVGSNIYAAARGKIRGLYNSNNIEEAYGTRPDLLIYAGLRAEKYLANNNPKKDFALILEAEENIRKIAPKKLVLISTIDVFEIPRLVDETSPIITAGLHAYGYNRYQLELWTRENYSDALIVRLPGLFGKNIKKNFIYDYIKKVPFMLKADKFIELSNKNSELKKYYRLQDNGFYKVNIIDNGEEKLKQIFQNLEFSALNFTDSRSKYQFYNLMNLWDDIQIALNANIKLLHLATEPVSAAELYRYLENNEFENELEGLPANYDYRTIYADVFGGSNGYIYSKQKILEEIKEFTKRESMVICKQ